MEKWEPKDASTAELSLAKESQDVRSILAMIRFSKEAQRETDDPNDEAEPMEELQELK